MFHDQMRAKRLRAKTDLERLNELIDWYNQFKPQAGRVIQVRFSTQQLERFAERIEGTHHWRYRERILEQLKH